MRGTVFLVHWRDAEAEVLAREIGHMGWNVVFESVDSARAVRSIEETHPDVVVIFLTRLPSHGRETGAALRECEDTCEIPLVYVNGNDEAVDRTRAQLPDAVFTTTEELERTLAGFSDFGC